MGKKVSYDEMQLKELLLQALETERGGIQIYEMAVSLAVNDDLRKEWTEYLEQTRTHEQVLLRVFETLGLDPEEQSPGRDVVGHIGASLVKAMKMAANHADPNAAQLVAGECVVLAETKDHLNWELIGHVAEHGSGPETKVLKAAFDAVEGDEDHHLYHTTGWTRELWIDSLGFAAVLPPPEEVKQVETAIGASRAQQSRDEMLKKRH
ncbi:MULTISPECIES: hypothetical protein [unclassified Lysobacter]|uniref:hypothetical protein n=1 Tax=unclassified Lysobacter TaxID=2635362 RepID=UPI0006F44AF6|nr:MULTISPECIES: hypothetical protein [unclassified Lysobacter]KRC38073.1 hypothetical protein ASE10_00280 [Lysobacter sp. Root76]KRD69397.1 hypothetical protein ASE45_09565 [Lysobacter sp. Root96]